MNKSQLLALLTLIVGILNCRAKNEIPTLADELSEYKNLSVGADLPAVMKLLEGETIRFSDFSSPEDITFFEYESPDTVWLKDRPKKNPKEGKHYELRKKYHGQKKTYYSITSEYTPAVELAGALFEVLYVEPVESNSFYTSRKDYRVHMENVANGERLYWLVSSSTAKLGFKVHLTRLRDEIGLKGRTLYSAKFDKYARSATFSEVTKHRCVGSDVYLDFDRYIPRLGITFTTVEEKNNTSDHALDFSPSSTYIPGKQWYGEDQIASIDDADKVHEIDRTVRMKKPEVEFPFSFRSVLGLSGEIYSVQVGQTISPSRYGISDELTPSGNIYYDDVFFIGDRVTVRGKDYYKAALDGKAFYIPAKSVRLDEEDRLKIDSLLQSPPEIRDAFFELAKALSYTLCRKKLSEAISTVDGYAAKGISIPSWSVYDVSEYTDGTGMRITFHNPTKKTIKYVNLTFVGYNAVDDRVGRPITKKCIGPIEPYEHGAYDFEYAWFTDVVEYAKITSLSVQYMDGTVKHVASPSSVVWPDEVHEGLKERLKGFDYTVESFE